MLSKGASFMITTKKLTGVVLAIGAASVFALAPAVSSAADAASVNCYGVNGCKGQGACKTADNSCKGQNACKGKGVMSMSAADCAKAGGKAVS
jgi:hypothetical protein